MTIQASELEDGEEGEEGLVPEEMREELQLGRGWVERHRKSLVGCHVFFKINFWLGRDNHGDSVVNAVSDKEIEEDTVELAKERQRKASVVEAGGGMGENGET